MRIKNPRIRMVTFRLSEDEYRRLTELVASENARSVSDIARDAIRARIGRRVSSRTAEDPARVAELKRDIESLNAEIDQIFRRLGAARRDRELAAGAAAAPVTGAGEA